MSRKILSLVLSVLMVIPFVSVAMPAFAWRPAPAASVDLSMKLVGMMNVKIFQDSPYIANVKTVTSGQVSGVSLYAYKFSGSGTSIGQNWPHQVGDGSYEADEIASLFGVSAVQECMDINKEEVAVYMLYDFGAPDDAQVQQNMRLLGITDIDEYYYLAAQNAKISIGAYAGGGTAHESAITAYYRFSDDWRTLANSNSGKYVSRDTLLDYGIAAPNENRYFYETKDSQKMLDGSDSIPGVFDPSVQQYIDEKESYSLPVWEDTDEDASWNIINPVPTCNIYSRWGTGFDKDTSYAQLKAIKDAVVEAKYGSDYTPGQWYAFTGDETRYYDGLDIDDMIVPKNWEWNTIPYYSTKSGTTYSATSASKSHLGYGEYVPAATQTYHDFYMPVNQANDQNGSRFMTVMIRETGTMCGLDGCGHWHSVKVNGVPTSNVFKFEPEINDDSVVIDYGLSTTISIDKNDWVWTTDPTDLAALPAVDRVEISADGQNFTTEPVKGKFGVLEIDSFSVDSWTEGSCKVKYTPKVFVDAPDEFYYKVFPSDAVDTTVYEPMVGKISVVPASLMYYEDSFSANDSTDGDHEALGYSSSLIYDGAWIVVNNGDQDIIAQAVDGEQSDENANYGYDIYYSDDLGYSDGSAHKSAKGNTLTFTFKGTGCDVIMRTAAEDGYVQYSATRSSINPDGSMANDAVAVTAKHAVNCRHDNEPTLYQLPVVNLRYDEYAYYTVTITGATSKSVYIDGIRVYNPLGFYGSNSADNETIEQYYCEGEKNTEVKPVYVDVYDGGADDVMVGCVGVVNNWDEWYGTEKNMDGDPADFESYLTIGPNNEVYLSNGQALVFNVTNADQKDLLFAVEAKAVKDPTSIKVMVFDDDSKYNLRTDISTNTAMYYEYLLSNSQIGTAGTIVVENVGDDILAISNFKYSPILVKSGVVDYQFKDESGQPVSGVHVIVTDKTGNAVLDTVTDSTGKVNVNNLAVGKYTAHFFTPEGYSSVATREFEFSTASPGDNGVFTLRALNLEIGSHPSIYLSATADFVDGSTGTVKIENYQTFSKRGSYEVVYNFAGTSGSSGYIDNKSYINGALSVVVNADGTASYNFTGTGKNNDRAFVGPAFGDAMSYVTYADNEMSIDYLGVLHAVTGYTGNDFKFGDFSKTMPEGTNMTIQAFEFGDAEGKSGSAETMELGAEAEITSDEKGTATFTFVDANGDPVQGVKVTINGADYYSDASGVAVCDNITLGASVASFETPDGLSGVRDVPLFFDPDNLTYSDEFTLNPLNLEIGSHPSIYLSTTADFVDSSTVKIENYRTFSPSGSYEVVYNFDGVSGGSGYIGDKSYLQGVLSVVVNSDGTAASYNFDGTGKTNDKTFAASSGDASSYVTYAENEMSIDYLGILRAVANCNKNDDFKFTDPSAIMPDDTNMTIQAFEYGDAEGKSGSAKNMALGAEAEITFDEKATVTYTFVDENGQPVAGVEVTIGDLVLTSDANGVVYSDQVALGNHTVVFKSPSNYSTVAKRTVSFDPLNLTDSADFTIRTLVLTVGSAAEPATIPTATYSSSACTLTFGGFEARDAGSYAFTFDLNAKIDNNNLINGEVTIVVNGDYANGVEAYCDFVGTGKANNKEFGNQNINVSSAVTASSNSITINLPALCNLLGNQGDRFKVDKMSGCMSQGKSVYVNAYELENGEGTQGEVCEVTVDVAQTGLVAAIQEIVERVTSAVRRIVSFIGSLFN